MSKAATTANNYLDHPLRTREPDKQKSGSYRVKSKKIFICLGQLLNAILSLHPLILAALLQLSVLGLNLERLVEAGIISHNEGWI